MVEVDFMKIFFAAILLLLSSRLFSTDMINDKRLVLVANYTPTKDLDSNEVEEWIRRDYKAFLLNVSKHIRYLINDTNNTNNTVINIDYSDNREPEAMEGNVFIGNEFFTNSFPKNYSFVYDRPDYYIKHSNVSFYCYEHDDENYFIDTYIVVRFRNDKVEQNYLFQIGKDYYNMGYHTSSVVFK